MTTPRTILVLAVGLLAGAIGFYAGLFALLAVTGLDSPGWAPVAQLTGSAIFIAAGVSMAAGLAFDRVVRLTIALTTTGVAAGMGIMALDLDFEAAIVAALILVIAAAAVTNAVDGSRSSDDSHRSDSPSSTG